MTTNQRAAVAVLAGLLLAAPLASCHRRHDVKVDIQNGTTTVIEKDRTVIVHDDKSVEIHDNRPDAGGDRHDGPPPPAPDHRDDRH